MDENTLKKLKEKCREMLKEDVEVIIVYTRKESEPKEILTVIESPDEIEKITLSPLSANNPAKHLIHELKNRSGKIGVVAKGCDSRAIKQLINEGKIDRERVHIIGISCPGIIDYRKLITKFKPSEVKKVTLSGDTVLVQTVNDEQRIPLDKLIYENCLYCTHPTPQEYDSLLGEVREGRRDFSDIEELEKMSQEERWNYWIGELEKCIRCFACRNACPFCYCTECLVDPTDLAISPMSPAEEKASYPRFLGKTVNAQDNLFYHLLRVIHHAGRCVGCGECERACPMDIPLRKLERKLEKEVIEVFGYIPDGDVPFLARLDILPEKETTSGR
jgi:ferredoxin